MDDPQRCGVDHTPTVTVVIAPVHRARYSDATSGKEDGAMYNDYGLANIAWQRQQEAERAAAAHRLVGLARLGTKGAPDRTGRLSLAVREVHRIGQMRGVADNDLWRVHEYP